MHPHPNAMLMRSGVGGGGGGARVSITDQNVGKSGSGPQTATYSLLSSGIAQKNGTTTLETWLLTGVNSDYEARATVTSGALSTGTTGSWLPLSTSRNWTVDSTDTATITVEIRDAVSGEILDTASVTISAVNTDDLG